MQVLRKKAVKIANEPSDPTSGGFELRHSARQYKVPKAKCIILKNPSFYSIPCIVGAF